MTNRSALDLLMTSFQFLHCDEENHGQAIDEMKPIIKRYRELTAKDIEGVEKRKNGEFIVTMDGRQTIMTATELRFYSNNTRGEENARN